MTTEHRDASRLDAHVAFVRACLEATPEGRRLIERYEAGDGSMHSYIDFKLRRSWTTVENADGEHTIWSEPIDS